MGSSQSEATMHSLCNEIGVWNEASAIFWAINCHNIYRAYLKSRLFSPTQAPASKSFRKSGSLLVSEILKCLQVGDALNWVFLIKGKLNLSLVLSKAKFGLFGILFFIPGRSELIYGSSKDSSLAKQNHLENLDLFQVCSEIK